VIADSKSDGVAGAECELLQMRSAVFGTGVPDPRCGYQAGADPCTHHCCRMNARPSLPCKGREVVDALTGSNGRNAWTPVACSERIHGVSCHAREGFDHRPQWRSHRNGNSRKRIVPELTGPASGGAGNQLSRTLVPGFSFISMRCWDDIPQVVAFRISWSLLMQRGRVMRKELSVKA